MSTKRFSGQTIAITGVGRAGQVGDMLAHAFARAGARVALIGRRENELSLRAAALPPGTDFVTAAADLTDPEATAATVAKVAKFAESGGGLRALVHAAGGFGSTGTLPESSPGDWHDMIAINLTTAYVTARAFLPHLRRTQGSLVFFSSEAALPNAKVGGVAAYASAKSGVIVLTRSIAEQELEHGVRANAVAPSAIRTPENEKAMKKSASFVEPADLADAIMYLVSDEAGAITGQVIALR
jgi:NAD(P)-dependent dehydrogenase (short-subunit alcohol dehydrogenase family)